VRYLTKSFVAGAAISVLALTGCADGRLNGGYNADVGRPMADAQTSTQSYSQTYIYRGGRDPVTGSAYRVE
jgi:hypothetical protein